VLLQTASPHSAGLLLLLLAAVPYIHKDTSVKNSTGWAIRLLQTASPRSAALLLLLLAAVTYIHEQT